VFLSPAKASALPCVTNLCLWLPAHSAIHRTAASAYAQQTRQAISSIQREYSLPNPDSRNVFSWQHRPDVRAVSDIMCKYIKDWDYRQVRHGGGGMHTITGIR
jgi:hypothetical protein